MTKWAAQINPEINNTNTSKSIVEGLDNYSGIDRIARMDIDEEFLKFFDAYQKTKDFQNSNSVPKANTEHQQQEQPSIPKPSTSQIQNTYQHGTEDGLKYKTPENTNVEVGYDECGHGKRHKRSLINTENPNGSFINSSELGEVLNDLQILSPKRPQKETMISNNVNDEQASNVKRKLTEIFTDETNSKPKYIKVESEDGRVISGYYTPTNEKKLSDFRPVYVTIGDTQCAKELIGLRKNTRFVGGGGKNKPKPIDDNTSYLVVSFENRKKQVLPS